MTIFIIALLLILGFIFLVVELFFVPGFSVPGLAGLAMIGYGIFKARSAYGTSGVLVTVAVSAVAAIILVRVALRSHAVRKIGLDYDEKEAKAVDDYSFLVGREGTALTTLRPSGTALIDGGRYNVVTDGEYMEKESPLVVSAVEGTRIIVSPIEKESSSV